MAIILSDPPRSSYAQHPKAHFALAIQDIGSAPGSVRYKLHESDVGVDAIFSRDIFASPYHSWSQWTQRLERASGLDLGMAYTAVYQKADFVVQGPNEASSADFDAFGRWHLTGCRNRWPGFLVFSTELRHPYSEIPPSKLNTGTVGGTITTFNSQVYSVVELYWEQGVFEDGLMVRIGKMDPALIWDSGRYVSSNYAFLNGAFSDTLPMALPGAGIGFATGVFPTQSTYIFLGIHDANGRRTTTGINTFFEESEYFRAVEFGWFPNEGKANEGLYHFTLWNIACLSGY